jgi:hypothetical protein
MKDYHKCVSVLKKRVKKAKETLDSKPNRKNTKRVARYTWLIKYYKWRQREEDKQIKQYILTLINTP